MRRSTYHRRGFTFLEIVFAVAILACAMVPIMTSMQFGTRRTGFNIKRITATMLSNQYMERYRSQSFDTLETAFGAGDVDVTELMETDPVLGSPFLPPSYKRLTKGYEVTASFNDVSGDNSLGLLSFKVAWNTTKTMKRSELSLGKVVVNYDEFGISVVGPSGSLLQEGNLAASSLTGEGRDLGADPAAQTALGNITDMFDPDTDLSSLINGVGSGQC